MIETIVSNRIWKFGDECDTGQIMPGKYVPLTDPQELASHAFEAVRPEFAREVKKGDVIVAGRNFGCGSSREHAPKAIRHSGVTAVLADSFARIFYRNSLNLGLLVIQVPGISDGFSEEDTAEIDMQKGIVRNPETRIEYAFQPYDGFIVEMINSGGIVEYSRGIFNRKRNKQVHS
jgi:3-isopropylmalate/(R)-2-methylmalate dehydratase small subunit